ncbi:hypothetical protein DNX69_07360 [Rhodopseudomonas palustris]|uniref:Uncharacterized protein n=1 Tax=Rhodopseudomonas palustris TaxID=1076 RepID=A0A323UNP9_RHOPL|nr:hypothetical protein [Rhodopseudomonas palustris]PZA12706.1 hypothetical protein DNX69_07360 [Rhodopseudomonas palustris]
MNAQKMNLPEIQSLMESARAGDPRAAISLAWEYFLGERVSRDIGKCYSLLEQAEEVEPERARFYAAKIAILLKQRNVYEKILADCDNGYAPSCFLMSEVIGQGLTEGSKKNQLDYLRRGAELGHIVSEFFLWRSSTLGILRRLGTVPYALYLIVRIFVTKYRDPHSEKTLT